MCVLYGPRHMERGVTPDVVLRGVTKAFGDLVAVDDVDLEVRPGEFLALLGPSGCGKTTTLRMIAGFDEPTAGEIEIGGRSAVGIPPNKRDVNTVFQAYALFPHMTVLDNVAYGLKQRKVDKAERRRQAAEALELVRLTGREQAKPRAALGRHAAARRARARARDEAEGAAARRAARRARPQAPQGDADRAQEHPARRRHHVHRGHARPGGGDVDGRSHRRDERRAGSTSSPRRRRSTTVPPRRSSPTSSAT